jgi:hypothetical protein
VAATLFAKIEYRIVETLPLYILKDLSDILPVQLRPALGLPALPSAAKGARGPAAAARRP